MPPGSMLDGVLQHGRAKPRPTAQPKGALPLIAWRLRDAICMPGGSKADWAKWEYAQCAKTTNPMPQDATRLDKELCEVGRYSPRRVRTLQACMRL